MEIGFTSAVYVLAAVLFILSLGGLSGQESAKRAVWNGLSCICHPTRSWIRALVALTGSDCSRWFDRLPVSVESRND